MQIDDLKTNLESLEQDNYKKIAEIKVARRIIDKLKDEKDEQDNSQMNMTMQTEVHVKLF